MNSHTLAMRPGIVANCVRALLLAGSFAIALVPGSASRANAALLHQWSAEDDATDSVGADDGTASGGVTYGDGLFGQGFFFDGVDGAVGFGTSAGNFGTGDFTIAFVVRTTATPGLMSIIGKREACAPGTFWDVRFYANGAMILELMESNLHTGVTTSTAINDGLYHTVVFARAGTVVTAYVDGFLDSQNDSGVVANVFNSAPLSVGMGVCMGKDSTVPFAGVLDELRLADHADPALLPVFLHCGDANRNGSISASDALATLRAAVGAEICDLCLCDPNESSSVTASDALAVLRRAVGQAVPMICPRCAVELPD